MLMISTLAHTWITVQQQRACQAIFKTGSCNKGWITYGKKKRSLENR